MGDESASRSADAPDGDEERAPTPADQTGGETDGDVGLTASEREVLRVELAKLYANEAAAGGLLRSLGIAPHEVSGFAAGMSAEAAWSEILRTLELGKTAAPHRRLITAALREYPENLRLLPLARRHHLVPASMNGAAGSSAASTDAPSFAGRVQETSPAADRARRDPRVAMAHGNGQGLPSPGEMPDAAAANGRARPG